MEKNAELKLDGKCWPLPVLEGTEKELAIDISSLRNETGYITLDDGYANTGSCQSGITFIDGERGILRYRGIPIEERSEEHTSELQSPCNLVCRLLLEKKKKNTHCRSIH